MCRLADRRRRLTSTWRRSNAPALAERKLRFLFADPARVVSGRFSKQCIHIVRTDEHLSRPRAVSRSNDILFFHDVEQPRRSLEANRKSSLQHRSGCLPSIGTPPDGFFPQWVVVVSTSRIAALLSTRAALFSGEFLGIDNVCGRFLVTPESAHGRNIYLAYVASLNTHRLARFDR